MVIPLGFWKQLANRGTYPVTGSLCYLREEKIPGRVRNPANKDCDCDFLDSSGWCIERTSIGRNGGKAIVQCVK